MAVAAEALDVAEAGDVLLDVPAEGAFDGDAAVVEAVRTAPKGL